MPEKPTAETIWAVIQEREKRFQERFEAQERALDKAETASEKRFDAVNEFRAQLKDYQTTLATKAEMDAEFRAQTMKIDAMEKRLNLTEGKAGGLNQGWLILVAAIGAVGVFFGLWNAFAH